MVTKTKTETLKKVERIVREAVEERFKDEYVFDPIVAIAKPDFWGDERIWVYVVHEGKEKIIDPAWTVGLVSIILENVTEEEVPELPFKFFIPKSEWDAVKRKQVEPWMRAA